MSVEQIKKFIADMDKMLVDRMLVIGEGTPTKPGVRAWLDARTKDDAVVSAARHRLIEHGLSAERLLRFPADQVILLDEKRELEKRFDDVVKTIDYPFWQVEAFNAQIELKKPPALFADVLVPIMQVPAGARARGPVDRASATRRGTAPLRRRARWHAARETLRRSRAAARRPVHRQAVPLRSHRQHGPPPRHSACGPGKGTSVQHALRGDSSEIASLVLQRKLNPTDSVSVRKA